MRSTKLALGDGYREHIEYTGNERKAQATG